MHDHYSSPTRRPDVLQMVNKTMRWMVIIIWPRTASEKKVGQDCNRLPTSVTSSAPLRTPCVHPPPTHTRSKAPGHRKFRPARRICVNPRCGCTCERLSIGLLYHHDLDTGQRRGDGDRGCHHGRIEVQRVGLSVQTAAKKVQWCVFPINVCLSFLVICLLSVSIDQFNNDENGGVLCAYISLACFASSHSPMAWQVPVGSTELVRAPGPPLDPSYYTLLPKPR